MTNGSEKSASLSEGEILMMLFDFFGLQTVVIIWNVKL